MDRIGNESCKKRKIINLKIFIYNTIFFLVLLLFSIINIFKYDLSVKFPYLALYLLFIFINVFIFVCMVILIVLLFNKSKIIALTYAIIYILFIYLFVFFPMSKTYEKFEYSANFENREKIVQMIEDGSIKSYQVDENAYLTPFRFASFDRRVYVYNSNGNLQVVFYSYSGFNRNKVIIYTSNEKELFYGNKYFNYKQLSKNWWSAYEK